MCLLCIITNSSVNISLFLDSPAVYLYKYLCMRVLQKVSALKNKWINKLKYEKNIYFLNIKNKYLNKK